MKDIYINLYSAGGVEDYYIPVPCRGIVHSLKINANATLVATGTITLSRSSTAVNTATAPTGDTAVGTILEGTPDTTNKDLIFDPDSETAAYKVIKVSFDTTVLGGAANVTLLIEYDDSAAVDQSST